MPIAVLLVGATLGLAGQAGASPHPDPGNTEVDPAITDGSAALSLRDARARWRAAGVASYRMTIVRTCFCIGPDFVRVTVRKRRPVRLSAKGWWGPRTVPGMFRVVNEAIANRAAKLDVTYDHTLGLPGKIWIDRIAVAVDDEIGYRIKSFSRL